MATKEEIVEAIEQGIAKVEATFGALDDERLRTAVHEGEGGWTAGEILAHLAGRGRGYAMMGGIAAGQGFPADFDPATWNRDRVAERAGKGRDELLAEFRAAHEALIAQVRGMDEDTLARSVQFGPQPITIGDMLRRSGGQHSVAHAEEVARALGLGA